MQISLSALQSGNALELLRVCYYLSPDKVVNEFKKVQVPIENEEDINSLAKISEQKFDVDGKLKDENGNPIMFDTIMVLNGIKFTPEEKSKFNSIEFTK